MYGSFPYRRSPVRVQESLLSAQSLLRGMLREGGAFDEFAARANDTQWLDAGDLRKLQARELRSLLRVAAREVPYYRERFAALGVDVETLALPEALSQLPLVDKAEVRSAGKKLISERRRAPLFSGGTSGTTGAPLTLWQDLAALNRENAFLWRQLAWAGLRRGERRAWMRGDLIVPASERAPPYWRLNRAENMLMLSSYHLSDAAAPAYLDALGDFDPVVIQAYPSSIGFLAGWMLSRDLRYGGGSLRGIVTSSETLSGERRDEIERAFGCRVFDWYGQFERVAAIGTCERGRHHLLADYSYVEMLPAGGGLFELVGTGFNNHSMPLVRYRCGDLVRPAPAGARCECGRSFPLIDEVVGRMDDAVRLADGRSIGRLDHIFKGVEGILEAQIRQDRLDAITILLVPAPGYGERTVDRLLGNARERLGERTAIEVRAVDSIPRTKNGKFRGVVSAL